MTIVVTYEKETGNVFQHFGKTEYFKLYQIEDGKIVSSKVIDNGGNGHHGEHHENHHHGILARG
jgi:predicted Fe-Mo cluster-binding NifX family protein